MFTTTEMNSTAAKGLLSSGILDVAFDTTNAFMDYVREKLTSSRVLDRPGILFTFDEYRFGELLELEGASSESIRVLASLDPLIGIAESQIAELVLRDISATFASLVYIGLTFGVRKTRGENPSRKQLSIERVANFSFSLCSKMNEVRA
jgi:hypothetical protein